MEGESPGSPHLKFPVIWAERVRRKEKAMRRKGRVKREAFIFVCFVVAGEFSGNLEFFVWS